MIKRTMKTSHFIHGILPVALQSVLILLLIFPMSNNIFQSVGPLTTLTIGGVIGLWTLFFNRIGNFNIHPIPKAGGYLVTTGPYRFVRHPMYTSVMLVMLAFVFNAPYRVIYWLLLLAVLWFKSSIEEKMLAQQYPEYSRYQKSAGRFLPYVFR